MSLTNVSLTSPLTYFTAIQPALTFNLSSSVSPLPPLLLAPVTQRPSAHRRHGNRLGRRSLNVGDGRSSKVLVSAKGGAKKIAINDDGHVTTTMASHSVYSALEVILLCSVAIDLNLSFPHCLTRETASMGLAENQSIMSFVLLFFRHSARYLCIDRKAKVYSLYKVGDYRSKVSECVFVHEIYASSYDTFHSRQYSPRGGATPCNKNADSPCHEGRWYLGVKGSNVTTRKTSKVNPLPPKSAQFIVRNVDSASLTDQGPLKAFTVSGSLRTPLPPVKGGLRRGKGPGRGIRVRGKGRTTEVSPFSVSQRRREQTKKKGGRKCGKNLLGRCVTKRMTTTQADERRTDRAGND